MLGMAAALVLGPWVAGAGAQSVLTPAYEQRQFLSPTSVIDEPVEMAQWTEDVEHQWVYVAGWMTHSFGGVNGTRMAIARYNALNITVDPTVVYYPPLTQAIATDQYRATGIVVDPVGGDVYICGEGTKAGGTTDFYVVKYKANLTQYTFGQPGYWAGGGPHPENVRIYDSGRADRPVDIIVGGTDGTRVVVTGSTETENNGKDFLTIAYDADIGSPSWTQPHQYNHSSNGDDVPVELCAWQVSGSSEVDPGWYIGVAGTSYDSVTGRDFLLIQIQPDGDLQWDRRFKPVGDDVCMGIAPAKQVSAGGAGGVVAVCGSTTLDPTVPTDTAFAVVAYNASGATVWPSPGLPFGHVHYGARFWNPGSGQDGAVDIAQASGPFWVTGTVWAEEADLGRDAGTIAYEALDGDAIGSDIFNYATDPGSDEIVSQIYSTGDVAYIVGAWYDVYNSPTIWRYLLLSYSSASPFGLAAYGSYDAGNDMENQCRAVTLFTNFGGFPGATRLFITGRSGAPTTGLDWVTLQYP